jgi:hypothetical protein
MANEVVQFNAQTLPAFARKAELSPLAKALAGGGGGGKRISIKGGVFRLLVDGEEVTQIEQRYLDVVIVNASPKVGRMYFEGKYKDDTASAPVCWSQDGDTPDASVQEPQSKSCATCPQNVKGSGDHDTRACRFSQRLAVVLANDMEGSVMQLSVPAKSLFGKEENNNNRPLQAYAKWLAAQNINPNMVITRLKFDTQAESPKLFFRPMRWLEESEWEIVQKQGTHADAIKAITMTVSQTDKVPESEEEEAPPPAPKKATAAAKPAPVSDDEDEAPAPAAKAKKNGKAAPVATDDEDDDAPAPEPTKRAGKAKPEETKATPALKNLVAAWGDDD